jgi:flagellar motor switch protein FliG
VSNVPNSTTTNQAAPLNLTPSQRAAVVIAMLGETAAKPIMDRLDDRAVTNIAASLETITYLDREQLIEVVIDFLRQLRQSSGALRGGSESARKILEGVLDGRRLQLIYGGGETPLEEQVPEPENKEDFSRLWETFSQREPAQIAKYLSGLTPNIIALILRNLDTTLCSELICSLDENTQTGVLGEMVDPPPPSAEIDSVIARMVRMDFLIVPDAEDEGDNAQLASVGEMLSLVPNDRRTSLMDYLAQSHAGKLDPIQKGMFEISDIPLVLNRNQVPILFKAIDGEVMLNVLAYMQEAYPDVAKYFLENISNRMADQIKDSLAKMKPPSPEDSALIERNFLTTMMDMKRKELIVILDKSELEEE